MRLLSPQTRSDFDPALVARCIGLPIRTIELVDKELRLAFEDGSVLVLEEASEEEECGNDCTLSVSCDDDLHSFVGGAFMGFSVRSARPSEESPDDQHDIEFLVVNTSLGDITLATHLVHNGYYGGFTLRVRGSQLPR